MPEGEIFGKRHMQCTDLCTKVHVRHRRFQKILRTKARRKIANPRIMQRGAFVEGPP